MAKKSKVELNRINENGRRIGANDRRKQTQPVRLERRKVQRRRQIDPTTCERDYTDEEIEFMQALDQYKRDSGRMFPTCSEILEVIHKLGYQKTAAQSSIEVAQLARLDLQSDPRADATANLTS